MSIDVTAPSAGESVTEIEINQWNVSDGDAVTVDQIIALAETEKATLEIRSPANGQIKIVTPVGSVVTPGTLIGQIEEGAAGTSKPAISPAALDKADNEKSVPSPAESLEPSETPAKTPIEPAPPTPKPTPNPSLEPSLQAISPSSPAADAASLTVYASPSVRRMIVENNVDIAQLVKSQGDTAPATSITEKDVADFLSRQGSKEPIASSPVKTMIPDNRSTSVRKMTRLRHTIAKRLVSAQHNAALLTTFNEIDMGEVMAIRNNYKELFKKKHEIGLGFMSFFVKAVCQALDEFPIINSQFEDDLVVEHHYADIGIAVATPKGLVVPIIRNAESLSFKEIEETIIGYAIKGKEGSIPMEDLTGGTFTITNGGTFGSMLSTPIINPPQSAILGMHNIVNRPVVKNGEIVIRPIMYVALTYDHRLIDGADSVRFLYRIKEFIEDPHRLLVGV